MITNMNTATLTTCDFWRETRPENMINDVQLAEGCLIKWSTSIHYIQHTTILLLGVNHLIRSFKWKKKCMLLSTSTSTTAAHFVGQTVDLPLFNNSMHFLHLILRGSPIKRCDSFLNFKGIMHRKHKRMLFHVDSSWCFRKPNIVNPLINQLDLNRSDTISTALWVLKEL